MSNALDVHEVHLNQIREGMLGQMFPNAGIGKISFGGSGGRGGQTNFANSSPLGTFGKAIPPLVETI